MPSGLQGFDLHKFRCEEQSAPRYPGRGGIKGVIDAPRTASPYLPTRGKRRRLGFHTLSSVPSRWFASIVSESNYTDYKCVSLWRSQRGKMRNHPRIAQATKTLTPTFFTTEPHNTIFKDYISTMMSKADLQFTVGVWMIPGGQTQSISPAPLWEHVPPFLQKLTSGAQAFRGREQFLPGIHIKV